jgi:hypothetical protein
VKLSGREWLLKEEFFPLPPFDEQDIHIVQATAFIGFTSADY